MQIRSRQQHSDPYDDRESSDRLYGDSPAESSVIPQALRGLYCLLGVAMLSVLVLARTLSPEASGLGTHQQLGLPPCGFILAFGMPCPSCGMTTSWAWVTRGDFVRSAQCNVGGLLLALGTLPTGIWLVVSGWRGRWVWRSPNAMVVTVIFMIIIGATSIQWLTRIL